MCPCSIANAVMFYDSLRHGHARGMRKPMRMTGGRSRLLSMVRQILSQKELS